MKAEGRNPTRFEGDGFLTREGFIWNLAKRFLPQIRLVGSVMKLVVGSRRACHRKLYTPVYLAAILGASYAAVASIVLSLSPVGDFLKSGQNFVSQIRFAIETLGRNVT